MPFQGQDDPRLLDADSLGLSPAAVQAVLRPRRRNNVAIRVLMAAAHTSKTRIKKNHPMEIFLVTFLEEECPKK